MSRVAGRAGESFLSPELQRERIRLAAAAHDVRIVAWYEDLDQSGGKWERPGFQAAIEAVERGEASVVVVARLTRFARSVLDTHRGLARLEQANAQLIAADVNVDVSTPTGKLVRDVLSALAEFELEVTRENWHAAKTAAVGRGVKIASRAPVGYRFDAAHRLEPDPETAHLIAEFFRRRAAGASRRELVEWWHERTGRWIRPQTVGDIIRNRSYLGEVTYGDLVNDKAHQALVTESDWLAAQSAVTPRAPRRQGTLLAGVLVCAGCGRKMVASTGSLRADGTRRLVYRCQKLSSDGPCPAPAAVIRERADEYVTDQFLRWVDAHAEGTARAEREHADAIAALDKAEAELAAYIRSGIADVIDTTAYLEGARIRQEAIDRARDEVAALRSALGSETLRTTVREEWPRLGEQERRRLIAAAVERVVVHRSDRRVPFSERCEIVFR